MNIFGTIDSHMIRIQENNQRHKKASIQLLYTYLYPEPVTGVPRQSSVPCVNLRCVTKKNEHFKPASWGRQGAMAQR